jgi:translation initiation factor IF-3
MLFWMPPEKTELSNGKGTRVESVISHLRLEVVGAKGYRTTSIKMPEALPSVEEALKDLVEGCLV